jgi:hypothetical protein
MSLFLEQEDPTKNTRRPPPPKKKKKKREIGFLGY